MLVCGDDGCLSRERERRSERRRERGEEGRRMRRMRREVAEKSNQFLPVLKGYSQLQGY